MQCPACHSENVQRLSLVYEQGTHNIKTTGRTRGSGIGVGRGGLGVGFGSATTTTTGTSQTVTAKKAAPPARKSYFAAIGLIIAGLLLVFMANWFLFGVVVIAGGGFLIWKAMQYNKNTYPPLYADWQKSWLCNKCGTIYQQ